ncbi:cation:proton antiporter, partial [bacterium]|nr:cation:proton antiporter [bacterium]
MNIYLFLSGIFLVTFILGKAVEKIRVPWIFSALILGVLAAIYNPFKLLTDSASFELLANLGMYFMLFMIGLDINLKKIKKKSGFIFKATFLIILSEAFFGSLLIHFLFNYSWGISFIVALSFATVGEAILIPILDEFKITKTKLGQVIINIGVLDDIIEILILITVVIIVGGVSGGNFHIGSMVFSLILLIILALVLINFKKSKEYFNFLNIKALFLFTIFIFFLFLGIGSYAEASALGALLAGMSIKNLLPKNKLDLIEAEIKAVSYGLFAPIFFFWVGLSLD